MQSVVRSTLVGMMALAALTACGDKTIVQPASSPAPGVQLVTVTPTAANLNVGDAITLGASVSADAGITDRTVTWSTSSAAIATVDASGNVKAIATGVATITATSNADKNVKGSALITVGAGSQVTVTIQSIVQNATGNNVDLANVFGQIDVTLNVDAGTNKLAGVDLLLNCNGPTFPAASDVVVATQTITSANVAPSAVEAAAPVSLSFNTAQPDSTGLTPLFKNGSCVVRGRARLAGSTQQSASNTVAITLNNADFIALKTFSTTATGTQVATATDANGFAWRAGSVNVGVAAISYSGRSYALANITLLNGGNDAAQGKGTAVNLIGSGGTIASIAGIAPASGLFTAAFSATDSTTAAGVFAATVDSLTVRVTTVDGSGNAGPTLQTSAFGGGQNFIRLDNRAPDITTTPVVWVPNTQNTQNFWVGKNFVFSVGTAATNPINPGSSANDNASILPGTSAGGVAKVVDTTQWSPTGAATWTSFTSPSAVPENSASQGAGSYDLRVKVCDALGNCRNTPVLTQFGVDLTAPTFSFGAATTLTNNTTFGIGQAPTTNVAIVANDPPGAGAVSGSGAFQPNPVLAKDVRIAPNGAATGQTTICSIGSGSACNPVLTAQNFVATATNPGQYTLTVTVVDQAGNQATPVVFNYYIDQQAPTVTGGFAIPNPVTTGSTFTTAAADSMDVAGSNGILHYPIALGPLADVRLFQDGTTSAAGTAFDNTLTRTATVGASLSNFYQSLATINGAAITAAVKPDQIGVRAVDAAGNLSTQDVAVIPANNVANGTAFTAAQVPAFTVASSVATVSNGTGTGATSTTLTASLGPVGPTVGAAFTQVCFYVATPAGGTEGGLGLGGASSRAATNDLIKIGCSALQGTVLDGAGNRTFTYSVSYDPPAQYGTAGNLNIFAIGQNAATDGLATAVPAVLALQP